MLISVELVNWVIALKWTVWTLAVNSRPQENCTFVSKTVTCMCIYMVVHVCTHTFPFSPKGVPIDVLVWQ